jgi:chitinase
VIEIVPSAVQATRLREARRLFRLGVMKLLFLLLCVMTCVAFARSADGIGEKRIVAYFADWSGSSVENVHPELLTHVIYAFAHFKDGEAILREDDSAATTRPSHLERLKSLKAKNPQLKTLFSLGGWGGSAPFSDIALTESSRQKFARSCAALASKHGFDGVDLDWEYPGGGGAAKGRPEDTKNFTLLLQELRRQLDAQGKTDDKRYLLTIAVGASPQRARQIELDKIPAFVDFVSLMTYDFAGGWSPVTGFNAPLYAPEGQPEALSVDLSVRTYLAGGVPREKLLVGLPFYGRAFGGVSNDNHGLAQPHDRKPPQPDAGDEWTYHTIVEHYLARGRGGARYWSAIAHVPWLYDPGTGVMVSYDDPDSINDKARYVKDKDLGGVMIWELSQDDEQASLLRAASKGLKG